MGVNMNKRIIGKNIKEYRIKLGLTQIQLAELLRSKGFKTWNITISRYESGKTAVSTKVLAALADIFNCEVNDITNEKISDTDLAIMMRTAADILDSRKGERR